MSASLRTIDLSGLSLAPDASFAARLREFAEEGPERVAIVWGERHVTWHQLWREVAGVARYLEQQTPRESSVCILSENRAEYVSAFMGIVASGRCATTLPTALPADVLATLLKDSEPAMLFVSSRYLEAGHAALAMAGLASRCEVVAWSEGAAGAGGWSAMVEGDLGRGDALPSVPLERPFNIVYSSGTTGTPKGIVHSHRTRIAMSQGLKALHFDRDTVALVSTALYTNFAIPVTLGTLWAGGRAVLMERFDPETFLELARSERATHFYIVPTQVQRLLDSPRFEAGAVAASRLVYVGGSLFHRELKGELMTRWPGTLLEVYGMTEGAPATALAMRESAHKLGSVGKPVQGCEIRIIDDEGHELPGGSIGEIVGRSGAMMLGYHNRPEATAALLWQDGEGRSYFRSGDIGRFDEDGFLYVLDRKKDMIISGGLNIYAADVEAVLSTIPEVAECAVVGVSSARWGETPVACVVLRSGATITAAIIRSWCNERLAKYQRLAAVHLMDQLPRNAMGKVMKRELRAALPPIDETLQPGEPRP